MSLGNRSTPLSVILVDDDNLFREALTANLINEGFAVKPFGSGQDILESISRDGTDGVHVILLDLKMPGMNGLEVLQALRASGVTLPVIILSDHISERYEQAALEKNEHTEYAYFVSCLPTGRLACPRSSMDRTGDF